MSSVWIYRQRSDEQRVSDLIWRAIKDHSVGSVDPKNPSLLAKRVYDTCRSIYDELDADLDMQYDNLFSEKNDRIASLENEIRELKGLPPLPPVAIA